MIQGLPQFQDYITLASGPVWHAFEAGHWLVPPSAIELADAGGLPALRLSLTRPAAPFLPPPPSAALDLTLRAVTDAEAALAGLREHDATAVLSPVYPAAGSARLEPSPGMQPLPDELAQPIEPIWSGIGTARFVVQLGIEAGSLLAGMIEEGSLPLAARMSVGFSGVSPRLPLEVSFDPLELFDALAPHLPEQGLTVTGLAAILEREATGLPVARRGTASPTAERELAEVLSDRLAARFGTLRPVAGAEPALVLARPDAGGSFAWDLSLPALAQRWINFRFDPFTAVREVVAVEGASRFVTRSVSMPLPTGRAKIWAFANLPRNRIGVEALGITVRADAAPPNRPHAAVASAMIEGESDTAALELQLSRGEPLNFAARGFAVIADALGVRRLEGSERISTGPILRLLPADFGIVILAIEAAPALLEEARIFGELRYLHEGLEHINQFELEQNRASCALGLPQDGESASLTFAAHARSGGGVLKLGPSPAQSTRVDMMSFREFGPQTLTVRCPPPPGRTFLAIDLASDSQADAEAEPLVFTAQMPERQWHYFARSPFRSGYRWRFHAEADGPVEPWHQTSSAATPLEPLQLRGDQT